MPLRLWSHKSIRYTVFAIHYTIRSPPQTRFRSFHATSLECLLWRRANRIAYSEYRVQYTPMWLQPYGHAPQSKNVVCAFNITHIVYFLFYLKIAEKKDYHCSSITKGSIYYIEHMYIQPFSMEVYWPEIQHLISVSTMSYLCTYCLFT